MNLLSTICRLTVLFLLSSVVGWLLTGCSDVKPADLSTLYPAIKVIQPAPLPAPAPKGLPQAPSSNATENSVTSAMATAEQNSTAATDVTVTNAAGQQVQVAAVALTPAATFSAVQTALAASNPNVSVSAVVVAEEKIQAESMTMQGMTIAPTASGSTITQPTAAVLSAGLTAKPVTIPGTGIPVSPDATLGFNMTTNYAIPGVKNPVVMTAPSLISLMPSTSGSGLSMSKPAIVPPGNSSMNWGVMNPGGGFASANNLSSGQNFDAADLVLSGLSQTLSRSVGKRGNGGNMSIRGFGLDFTCNDDSTWTLPASYTINLQTDPNNSKYYILNNSTFTLTWDPKSGSVLPTDGKCTVKIKVWCDKTGSWVMSEAPIKTVGISGNTATFSGFNTGDFDGLSIFIDCGNTKSITDENNF